MTSMPIDANQLNYRVVGVCIVQNHVLLHREEKDDFWVLPGGRLHLHESSRDALVREMHEEIAIRVDVGRLLWVNENFFHYAGERWHELALYFAMEFPADSSYRDIASDFTGKEGEITLLFRWFPLDRLDCVTLYPSFLKEGLLALPPATAHVIHIAAANAAED